MSYGNTPKATSKTATHKLFCPHPAVSGNSKHAYRTY